MQIRHVILIAVSILFSSPALAQVVTTTTGQDYLAVVRTGVGGVCLTATTQCVSPSLGVSLSNFATSASVSSQFATANGQIAALNSQVTAQGTQITTANGQITTLNNQMTTVNGQVSSQNAQLATFSDRIAGLSKQLKDSQSYTAAVGAMHDAIPAPGDNFAVRFNAASVNGVAAAGASFSANITEKFRASVNYAGSGSGHVVSGGLNFSFN